MEVTAQDFPYRERPGRLVLANDITERKRLEKEILEISNREQRRIGQDLHDRLGQLLTGIGFRVSCVFVCPQPIQVHDSTTG